MTGDFWIDHVRIVSPGEGIAAGAVLVAGGKISRVAERASDGVAVVDGGGKLLTPGLVDLHTHGLRHYMYENGPEDMLKLSDVLPAYGTTCALPTIIPGPKSLPRLEKLAETLDGAGGACLPGFHLEGPFVALTGAACVPVTGDVGHLKELLAASKGRVKAMSVSPEVPGIIPVIEYMCAHGIAPFMTHTRASAEETEAAIAAGARHATHFYDVFPIPQEREPGVRAVGAVEAILADRRVSADFICDGCHVAPVAIRATLAAKGYEGVVLISDSNIGAGLPPGTYDTPWGYPVRVKEGDGARIADPKHRLNGALAGSALTMDLGMRNLLKWLTPHGVAPAQVWAMGSTNPARVVGLGSKGFIRVGGDADLVLWNDDITVARTWVGGRSVYEA